MVDINHLLLFNMERNTVLSSHGLYRIKKIEQIPGEGGAGAIRNFTESVFYLASQLDFQYFYFYFQWLAY